MTQRGDTQINVFTKGLITESNPLNFPVDAAVDVINMHLKRNGTMERRLGMDFEDSYVLNSTGLSSDVLSGARVTAYRWSIPNGQSEVDIGVIQIGNSLYFLDLYAVAPSAVLLNGGVPVTAVGTSNDQIMSFATINNYLVAVSNALADPYLFSYDADTDVVSWETAPILIRDLYGVDDGLDVNERPTTLSSEHTYNLKNQGWNDDIQTTCGAGVSPINCTFNTFGIYPSNSDIWSLGRIEDLTDANVYKFDPNLAARNLVQIGQASKGHFIIPIFGRGQARQDLTGLTLPADRETGAITYVASYAGRVFYAGILSRVVDGDNNSPSFSGTVFFSQTFTNKDNLIKCYQEADPTSPEINDIIDTDGGVIQIPGCNYIYALIPTKTSLFVFGANGVWEIRGDEGGFRATSFQVNKISNVGVYAPKSIVEINNTFIFWGDSGIYTLSPNEFGLWNTENITLNTIQRFFNALPDSSKKNARGYHDLHTNTARWLYYSPNTKQLGNPIDSDLPGTGETPFLVGSVVTIPDISDVRWLDCQVQNSNTYIVTSVTGVTGSREIWATVVTTSGTFNTIATVSPSVLIDNSIEYNFLSHCRLSDTKFIIFSREFSATNNLYAIVCTISGTTITTSPKQLIRTISGAQNFIKAHAVDENTVLLGYLAIVGNYPALTACTISGTTITVGAETTLIASAGTSGVDIEDTGIPGDMYITYPEIGVWINRKVNVSGTTITLGTKSNNLNLYSGTSDINISYLTSEYYTNNAQNILAGDKLSVNSYSTPATIYNTFSTDIEYHPYSDITGTTGNRIFLLYCANPTSGAAEYVEMERFTFTGSSITSNGVTRISNVEGEYISISNDGFTPTRSPVAYINVDTTPARKIDTFIWEAGS